MPLRSEQFPAILYLVLQEIEAEGYACREIYVDTFKVNMSAAAEGVAAIVKVRLVPASSGTPQEIVYAESTVRTIASMSRSLLAGAPHLDDSAYLHDKLPQPGHDNISPHEIKTRREPE
jgi:hypothetical protein